MDMDDISNLLAESHRVLKNEGKAYVSILHPCFTPPVGKFRRGLWGRISRKWAYFHLNNYLHPIRVTTKHLFGSHGPTTNYYHRTLSEYSDLFAQAGWKINSMVEPIPTQEFIRNHPQFHHATKIAIFLIFELSIVRHPESSVHAEVRDLGQQ